MVRMDWITVQLSRVFCMISNNCWNTHWLGHVCSEAPWNVSSVDSPTGMCSGRGDSGPSLASTMPLGPPVPLHALLARRIPASRRARRHGTARRRPCLQPGCAAAARAEIWSRPCSAVFRDQIRFRGKCVRTGIRVRTKVIRRGKASHCAGRGVGFGRDSPK